jgi:hypothetical protein
MADTQSAIPDFQLPDDEAPDFVLPGGEQPVISKPVRDVPPQEVPVAPLFAGEGMMSPPSTETVKTKGYEDYPTFAEFDRSTLPSQQDYSLSRDLKLSLGYAFANGPQERADIIQKNIPEAEFTQDKYGNPLVSFNGEKYHIDKPTTMNWQNVKNLGYQSAAAIPLTAAAAAAPVGALGTAALLGAAGAGTSILGDIGANLSGANQQVDYGKAGVQGLIGAGGSMLASGLSKFAGPIASELSDIPSAVKNIFVKSAPSKGVPEMPAGSYPASDMVLHEPSFTDAATGVVKNEPNSPAAKQIISSIEQHSSEAPLRIGADVDQAFGPATQSERGAAQALLAAKKNLSPQLDTVLSTAKPVDPSNVVNQIDNALQTAPKGSPTESLLRKARGMLVEQDAIPGIPNKIDPQTGLPLIGTGSAGKPAVYVTDPRTLENARLSLDRIIKFGDPSASINPNVISPQDYAVTGVRTALSKTLKDQISGYEELMGKYSDIYSMLDANEQGANIFGKGKDALRPDQVSAMAADPLTGNAFKVGARAAVTNKLATSPDDIKALKTMVGGPGDYTRQNIETLYGPNSIGIIQNAAQREANSNEVAKRLISARTEGQRSLGAKDYQQSTAPLSEQPIKQAYTKFVQKPINSVIDWARGRTGAEYSQGFGNFLTMPRNAGIKGLQSALQGQAAARAANKAVSPALSAVEGATNVQQQNSPVFRKAGGSVGRIGRASGGKVKKNVQHLVDRLMNLAEQAKRSTDNNTKPLLDAPDASIVKALRVANEAI